MRLNFLCLLLGGFAVACSGSVDPSPTDVGEQTASASLTATPDSTATATPTASQTPTGEDVTSGQTPTPDGTSTPGQTPTAIGTPTPNDTPAPTPNGTPAPTPNGTPAPTPNGTPAPTPNGTPAPTPNGTPAPTPTAVELNCTSITKLQDPNATDVPALNTPVKVCGAIVTAVEDDGFFLGMSTGGAYSGIYVYIPQDSGAAPAELAVGDVVDVEGLYGTFAGFNQVGLFFQGAFLPSVEILSSGNPLPEPALIVNIGNIASQCETPGQHGSSSRFYEGVRVRVLNVNVSDDDPCGNGRFGVFEVDGGLLVDDDFGSAYHPPTGQGLTSVTGVLHLRYDLYRLFPGPGDIVSASPTPSPTPLPTPTALPTPTSAPTPVPTPLPCTPISVLQNPGAVGHPADGTVVRICDAVVTSTTTAGHIFIQDRSGGAWSGIYIFQSSTALIIPYDTIEGDAVTVVGRLEVYDGVYQIALRSGLSPETSITRTSANNLLPAAQVINVPSTVATNCATLVSGSQARQYEAVRVQVQSVLVTDLNPCDLGGFGVFAVTGNLLVDDFAGSLFTPISTSQSITRITGVLHRSFETYRLLPGPFGVEP